MTIPNLRVPFVAVEFNNSRASGGTAELAYTALIIGQMTGEGTATPNTRYRVTNAAQVQTLAGRGSQLHRMALKWFANNTYTETWIGVVSDNLAGAFASGTLTFTGPATETGTLSLYVGGNLVSVGVSSGDSASTIAANTAAALGIHASGNIEFDGAGAGDSITIGTTTFQGVTGSVTAGDATYSVDTSDSARAASLANQVNRHPDASKVVRAYSSGPNTYLLAVVGGTAGNSVVLTSVNGATTIVSGSGTLTSGGVDTDLPVFATVNSNVVTVRPRNRGPQGNDIDLRLNYADGEATPAGVGCTISGMVSGTTAPVLTSLIAALGDAWFQVIVHPYTDSTSLTALETEMASRFGPLRMIDGVLFTGAAGSVSTLATLGNARNSKHSCILSQPGANPLTPPAEFAAAVGAVVAYEAAVQPALPFQTLPVLGVLPTAEGDLFTLQERDSLLFDGIATTRRADGGGVVLERLITTYKTNSAGAADVSYLDVTTLLTLLFLRYSARARIMNDYPRHLLMDDGQRVGAGQRIVTPQLAKASLVMWFREMQERGLVENLEQFKTDLVVVRDPGNRNRLNFTISPDLANQFMVGAVDNQFIL